MKEVGCGEGTSSTVEQAWGETIWVDHTINYKQEDNCHPVGAWNKICSEGCQNSRCGGGLTPSTPINLKWNGHENVCTGWRVYWPTTSGWWRVVCVTAVNGRSDASLENNLWSGFCCFVFFFLIISVLTFPNGITLSFVCDIARNVSVARWSCMLIGSRMVVCGCIEIFL